MLDQQLGSMTSKVFSNLNDLVILNKPHPKCAPSLGWTFPRHWETQTPPGQLTTVMDSLCILQLLAHIHLAGEAGLRIAGASTFAPGCRVAQGIAGAPRALPQVMYHRRRGLARRKPDGSEQAVSKRFICHINVVLLVLLFKLFTSAAKCE